MPQIRFRPVLHLKPNWWSLWLRSQMEKGQSSPYPSPTPHQFKNILKLKASRMITVCWSTCFIVRSRHSAVSRTGHDRQSNTQGRHGPRKLCQVHEVWGQFSITVDDILLPLYLFIMYFRQQSTAQIRQPVIEVYHALEQHFIVAVICQSYKICGLAFLHACCGHVNIVYHTYK